MLISKKCENVFAFSVIFHGAGSKLSSYVLFEGDDELLLTLLIHHVIFIMHPHRIVLLLQGIHMVQTGGCWIMSVNSLFPGWCGSNLKIAICKHMQRLSYWSLVKLLKMPHKTFDDESALVQVMYWCHHPTLYNECNYLSIKVKQC